jgi:hypothetical protein
VAVTDKAATDAAASAATAQTAAAAAQSTADTAKANAAAAQTTADQAKTAAATAQTAANTAQTTAAGAKTDAATAQTTANAAQTTANAAKTAAATAQTTADTAKTNAATAQTAADTAKTNAATAQTTADTAKTNAATAQTAANTAQTTANTAKTDAATASAAAADAAGIANGKGKVIYATAAPTAAADKNANNLWIDISGSPAKNQPYRWSGAAWVAVTDKAATDAAASAATAQTAAATAQTTADTAKTNAATAQTAANTAQTTADTAKTNAATAQTAANNAKAAADAAQTTANAAKTAAATAQTTADAAKTAAATAQTAANNAATAAQTAANAAAAAQTTATAAKTAAATAQTTADAAKTAAASASTAAADAAGIANGKGKVIYATAAPTATADKNANNLWIDISGTPAKNQPYRWTGSAWVAITDKAAVDAAAAAATAQAAAATAQTTADQAKTAAATAQTAANNAATAAATAQTTANNAQTSATQAGAAAAAAAARAGAALLAAEDLIRDPCFATGEDGLGTAINLSYSPAPTLPAGLATCGRTAAANGAPATTVRAVVPGATYRISAWVRPSATPTGPATPGPAFRFTVYHGASGTTGTTSPWLAIGAVDAFTRVSWDWTCPVDGSVTSARIVLNGSSTGVMWYITDWHARDISASKTAADAAAQAMGLLATTAATLTSLIDQTSSNILLQVGSQYATTTAVAQAVTELQSSLSLLANQLTVSFSNAQSATAQVNNSLVAWKATVETWFKFSAAGLDIGKADSPYSVHLDEDELSFLQNGNIVATFTNQQLVATRVNATAELRFGPFAWSQSQARTGLWNLAKR